MEPKVKIVSLEELRQDSKNANRGTPRGMGLLEDSLQNLGAGRSILIDRDGNIIAGNKTAEKALERGFSEVIVVSTNGQQLVAVQREDLDINEPRARQLAIADNRVAEVNLSWDADVLKDLQTEVKLDGLWTEDEFRKLLDNIPAQETTQSSFIAEQYFVIVACKNETQQAELIERLSSEGLSCRASIS